MYIIIALKITSPLGQGTLSPCPALKYWINQEVSTVFSMPSYTDTHTYFFLPPLGMYERMA